MAQRPDTEDDPVQQPSRGAGRHPLPAPAVRPARGHAGRIGRRVCRLAADVLAGLPYVGDAWDILRHGGEGHSETQVTVPILEAVDSFLFGVVLIIFAYGIAVGFVFRLPARIAKLLPAWMKIEGVGQLKQILAEVVIVVLIVIFARVVVESGSEFSWNILILPVAIILISGALWFLDLGESRHRREDNHQNHDALASQPDHEQ